MIYFEQMVSSFIASMLFGVIFNVPRNRLVQCGIVGMVGWTISFYLSTNLGVILVSGISSFFVAVVSHIFSKYFKTPVIIFSVCGVIPLVPGGMAYNAMRNFVENNYEKAIDLSINTVMISGSIVLGIICSELVSKSIFNTKLKHSR